MAPTNKTIDNRPFDGGIMHTDECWNHDRKECICISGKPTSNPQETDHNTGTCSFFACHAVDTKDKCPYLANPKYAPQESSPGELEDAVMGALTKHHGDLNWTTTTVLKDILAAHTAAIQVAKREAKESGYHDGCIATDRFMEHHYRIKENKVWIEEYRGCIKLCLPDDTKTISWYEGRIYDHEKRIKRLQELEEETTS